MYSLASDTKSCLLTTVELGHTFQAVFESQSKTLQACYTLFHSNLQCAGPKATSHSDHSCRTEQSVSHIIGSGYAIFYNTRNWPCSQALPGSMERWAGPGNEVTRHTVYCSG